jgi:hypothetical protein
MWRNSTRSIRQDPRCVAPHGSTFAPFDLKSDVPATSVNESLLSSCLERLLVSQLARPTFSHELKHYAHAQRRYLRATGYLIYLCQVITLDAWARILVHSCNNLGTFGISPKRKNGQIIRARFFSSFAAGHVHINNIHSPCRSGPMWNLRRISTPF